MRIKSIFLALFTVIIWNSIAQDAIHNYGNLKLHQKGSLGFHTDLINDGSFDENLGIVGFYNHEKDILIDGAFSPRFHDLEVGVENNLFLGVSLDVDHSLYFIYGNISSDKARKNISLKLDEKSTYEGVSEISKVNGFVTVQDQKEFTFPIGDSDTYKPLTIKFVGDPFLAKCAYFAENPEFPSSIAGGYDSTKKDEILATVFPQEFWILNTSGRLQITLYWDPGSNLSYFTEFTDYVVVTGWNKDEKKWKDLGNALIEGDMANGSVTSTIFNANNYEIFTLGFRVDQSTNAPGNYAYTPNGDGINDNFTLPIIKRSPNNLLQIFNRSGQLVYKQPNYSNEFNGKGNISIFSDREELPEGVYFYLIELHDLNQKFQGYFYLAHD